MRITGYFKKRPMHILVDSGSTHNFSDIQLATKMGCLIKETHPLSIVVANRAKVSL